MIRLLPFLLVLLAAPAWAAEPLTDLLIIEHELDADSDIGHGTVAFTSPDGAVFASPAGTYQVSLKKGRPVITKGDGHPKQDHHKTAESISLGAAGALVLLTDDRKRLQIARYDAATATWLGVERPIGFVPRGAAVVSNRVVFPQAARSPAWFVYDVQTNTFGRIPRPDSVASCAGTTFASASVAVVVGADSDDKPCAVSLEPSKPEWKTLAPAPKPAGRTVVNHASSTIVLGPKTDTMVWAAGTWTTLPALAKLTSHHVVSATADEILAWRLNAGALGQWVIDRKTGAITSKSEPIDIRPRSTVQIGPTSWLVAGQRGGRPVLVEITYSPHMTTKERAENRAKLAPASAVEVDWKAASESERRAALEKGIGAVERYVPPELNEKGGVKTKGAWVFALGEELVVWPVTPKTCQRFIDKMLAKWPTTVVGTTWRTERGAGFARSSKKMLFSPSGQCRAAQKCATDYFSQRATVLSQVGPIFTYSEYTSAASDCAAPTNTERWHSVDLRTGKPATMTAVIKHESILAALKAHKNAKAWVAEAATLDEAIELLRKKDPNGFVAYAFGGWRSMSRRVEMRLEYHPSSADIVEPIKIWVEPTEDFVNVFEEAARTKGMFMGSSE